MNAIIFSAILGVIMMFIGAFVKSKTTPRYFAIAGTVLLLVVNSLELFGVLAIDINVKEMLRINKFTLTFLEILFACSLIFFLISGREIENIGDHVSEYFALLFFVLCGVSISCTYNTLLMLFLGIEIMSIPLYVLTGSDKQNLKGNEASLKYFLMGAFSTGIMLMGIAFIYGGNSNASFYINSIMIGEGKMPTFIAIGLVFLVVAMSFKVSAAPFHFWTPDVYDGAPTVFTSFMSTIVKAAGFFAFVRLFEYSFGIVQPKWQNLISFIIVATLLIGNITAVFQQSVKRMLAYSSIAQAGFMLFAVFALNETAKEGLILYAAAYCLATIGLFAILLKMSDYTIDGFNGLSKSEPLIALAATIFLFSLTGIPLTAGFQAKFLMLVSAANFTDKIWLVIVAVIFAAISSYYYFRVIQAMYFKNASNDILLNSKPSRCFKILLLLIALLILVLGIYPELAIGWMYS